MGPDVSMLFAMLLVLMKQKQTKPVVPLVAAAAAATKTCNELVVPNITLYVLCLHCIVE